MTVQILTGDVRARLREWTDTVTPTFRGYDAVIHRGRVKDYRQDVVDLIDSVVDEAYDEGFSDAEDEQPTDVDSALEDCLHEAITHLTAKRPHVKKAIREIESALGHL